MVESKAYSVHLIYRSIIDKGHKHSHFTVWEASCAKALDSAYTLVKSYIEAETVLYWSVELVEGNERGQSEEPRVPGNAERREASPNRRPLSTARLCESSEVGDLKRRKRRFPG
jgi:hypothetical protein